CEYWQEDGRYSHIPMDERHRIYARAIELLNRTRLAMFSATVIADDFYAMSEEDRKLLGSPYILCASSVGGDALRWMHRKRRKDELAIAFEENDESGGLLSAHLKAQKRFSASSNVMNREPHSWSTSTKVKFAEFQAADIIAWESRKRFLGMM